MELIRRSCLTIYCSVWNFFHDEDGAVDIVAIVVLIGIAVLLAVMFKEQIAKLLNDLMNSITGQATDAVNNPATPGN